MRFNYPEGITNPLNSSCRLMPVPLMRSGLRADVVVFEFKGSLLTHAAKSERNFAEFERLRKNSSKRTLESARESRSLRQRRSRSTSSG
jgi:hypothetical protein